MKIKNLIQITRCFPSQWEAKTEEGKYLYIRCDGSYLSIELAESEKDWMDDKCTIIFEKADVNYHGIIDTDEMLEITGLQLI